MAEACAAYCDFLFVKARMVASLTSARILCLALKTFSSRVAGKAKDETETMPREWIQPVLGKNGNWPKTRETSDKTQKK